jgi:hypothetical protein
VERVRSGQYVVDPDAVAAAIVRRWTSAVLVSAEPLDDAAGGVDDDEPAAGDDLS